IEHPRSITAGVGNAYQCTHSRKGAYDQCDERLGSDRSRAVEERSPCRRSLYLPWPSGDLAKILWHDGIGLSLYAKRLDRGKFIWPSASYGAVSISAAQMPYLPEGIHWRN